MTEATAANAPRTFLILSVKWSRSSVLTWWGPGRCGYVWRIDEAGLYTEAEAREIEASTHTDAIAVPLAEAEAKSARVVFDFAFGDLIRERQRAHRCSVNACEHNVRNQKRDAAREGDVK